MRPRSYTDARYVRAFSKLAQRVARSLATTSRKVLPIKMYVAGGAALHFYTGARVSVDVDAAFSHRVALPENLEIAYRQSDGTARLLYFDRQYSDVLGLMHEDAYDESVPLSLPDIDPNVLDIRLLAPIDLAVSKLGRFAEQDRQDIVELAKRGLIDPKHLRMRAEAALGGYVGDIKRTESAIEFACRMLEGAAHPKPVAKKKPKKQR